MLYKYLAVVKNIDNGGIAMERKNIFDNNRSAGRKLTYYIVLGICVLVIGAASFLSYRSIQNAISKEETPEEPNAGNVVDNDLDNITETDKTEQDVTETEKKEEDITEDKQQENVEQEQEKQPVVETKSYVKPVDGEIMVGFSLETPVYSTTLKDWRIHDGIDIAADLGTNVVAVNDGVVESIESDDLFGIVVTIKHTDGKKSVYANLEDSVELEKGQIINRSDIVGKVGNTAIYEISDGPHLHFEMSENGEKIDPTTVIK